MAGSDGEHGSKENSGGGCYGYFSAQPWWACQMLTERETRRENAQPLETWRFTPLTYLAWIGPLPHCSISNTALSPITEIDDGHVVCRSRWRLELRLQWWRGQTMARKLKFFLSRNRHCYICRQKTRYFMETQILVIVWPFYNKV